MSLKHTLFYVACLVFVTGTAIHAQNPIPNPGFEDWTPTLPEHWLTSELTITGSAVQTAMAHSGISAIELNVVEYLPGIFGSPSIQSEMYPGFAVGTRWDEFRGYYDFTTVQNDIAFFTVSLFKDSFQMGAGAFFTSTGTSGYEEFVVPIIYFQDSIPDSAYISVYVTGAAGSQTHLGTRLLLDDFSFVMDTTGGSCPITMTGDVNLSGTVNQTDIIYLVNSVFKAGADALPCPASGDVNCSGSVNQTDIIYLVNSVFKAGPAPCDVCTLIPGTWSCP